MSQTKKTINLAVPADLAAAFDDVSAIYGHGKQKGMVLAAAMQMFLDSEPGEQARYVKRMATEPIDSAAMRLAERRRGAPPDARPRIAAKKAGDSVKALRKLPDRPGHSQK